MGIKTHNLREGRIGPPRPTEAGLGSAEHAAGRLGDQRRLEPGQVARTAVRWETAPT